MELLELETRRDIKPGDIFRAHLAVTAGEGGMSELDRILAAKRAPKLQQQEVAVSVVGAEPSEESGMFHGHEPFAARKGPPYHWGVSLAQPPSSTHSVQAAQEKGDVEDMERLQIGVMDAIHDALSKEALIKKLIIPFNGSFTSKHAVSHWEWQKNTALLELEQQNQKLQHQLRNAAKQVSEAQNVAQHDRRLLEEALKKGKDELYLIRKAEIMRVLLIEQKQVNARYQILHVTLSSWQRFCHGCKEKRALKRLLLMWHQRLSMKCFDRFVHGYQWMKHSRLLKVQARSHWVRKSLRKYLQSWSMHLHWIKEAEEKIVEFVKRRILRQLRVVCDGWRDRSLRTAWKQIQQKKALNVWSFSYLRKGWQTLHRYASLVKENNSRARNLFHERLVWHCFLKWQRLVRGKLQRSKQEKVLIKVRESRLHQIAFNIWKEKTSISFVVGERLRHFLRRRQRRWEQVVLKRWEQLVVRTRCLRTLERILLLKAKTWSKRWAFQELKRHWTRMKVVQESQTMRLVRTRFTFFQTWRAGVRRLKHGKWRAAQMQKRVRHRRQQRLFSFWMVYTAASRNSAVAKEANQLTARVKMLETNIEGAERVRHQMDNLVHELEHEKEKILISMESAVARTPVWTSGFLDVELRWTTLSLTWPLPPCAGHTAVSLPGRDGTCFSSRIVYFGGYNGEEYLKHVLVFETGQLLWKVPHQSAGEGSVVPPAMQTHTACAFGNNKMVVFGGYDGAKEFAEVSMLTVSDDGLACEWSQLQCMVGAKPGPICQHTSCLYEDGPYMVVFGGYQSGLGLLNELWILDLHWLKWSCPDCFGTPPGPCRGHAAAMVGKTMYIFGGYNGKEHLADLHALNMETMTWECIDSQGLGPSPRRQHSLTAVDQHLVIYGGYDGRQYLGDVFSFDTVRRRWSQWPDRQSQRPLEEVGQGGKIYGRSMHTTVKAGQRLLILGGVHEWGALQDMVFLENAAAVDGLQLQMALDEELDRATKTQAKVVEYEKALAQNSIELAKAQQMLENFRSVLQVETEKRKKAVQGTHILTKKLQKARSRLYSLSQTCKR